MEEALFAWKNLPHPSGASRYSRGTCLPELPPDFLGSSLTPWPRLWDEELPSSWRARTPPDSCLCPCRCPPGTCKVLPKLGLPDGTSFPINSLCRIVSYATQGCTWGRSCDNEEKNNVWSGGREENCSGGHSHCPVRLSVCTKEKTVDPVRGRKTDEIRGGTRTPSGYVADGLTSHGSYD